MRRRVLKRGARVAVYRPEAHNKTLWAAYRMGAFPHMQAGIEAGEFPLAILSEFANVEKSGARVGILEAPHHGEMRAVGLVVMQYSAVTDPQTRQARPVGNPDPVWFPWASVRNRLECAMRLIMDARPAMPLFKVVKKRERNDKANGDPLLAHLRLYGLARPIGVFWKYYPDGTDGVFWQTT